MAEMTVTLDGESEAMRKALDATDYDTLAAMACRYRAQAARWRAEAEEKDRTVMVLVSQLATVNGLLAASMGMKVSIGKPMP